MKIVLIFFKYVREICMNSKKKSALLTYVYKCTYSRYLFQGGGGFLLFVGFYVQLNELNKID